jgi:hypothetical protein
MTISENRLFSCRGNPTEKSGTAYKEVPTVGESERSADLTMDLPH